MSNLNGIPRLESDQMQEIEIFIQMSIQKERLST